MIRRNIFSIYFFVLFSYYLDEPQNLQHGVGDRALADVAEEGVVGHHGHVARLLVDGRRDRAPFLFVNSLQEKIGHFREQKILFNT